MSSDPEAIIYYGFPLVDFECDDYAYHDVNDEWEKEHRPSEPEDKSDCRTQEWDDWRTRFNEWKATEENIEIEWSGAEDCETYYVHARGFRHCVEWGEQKPLSGVEFGQLPEVDKQLRLFCDRFGVEWKQPGWHLAARYF